MANLAARALTSTEVDAFVKQFGTPIIPVYGKTFITGLGTIVVFDGADLRRRYTLISGPDASAVAQQIDKAPYTSPDAGLWSFLDDLTKNAENAATNITTTVLIGAALIAAILLLKRK